MRFMKKLNTILSVVFVSVAIFLASPAGAAQYSCAVKNKFDIARQYSKDDINKGAFSVKIKDEQTSALISRCSFSISADKITCDEYEVDKIVYDKNAKIKKFYVFRSQFDIQIFSDLTFVENNGRGGIGFGSCEITSP